MRFLIKKSGVLTIFASTTGLNLENIWYRVKRELGLPVEHTERSMYTHVIILGHQLHLGSIHQVNKRRLLHFSVLAAHLIHFLKDFFLVLQCVIDALLRFWIKLVWGVTTERKSSNKAVQTNRRVLNVDFFEASRQTICIPVIFQLKNLWRWCPFLYHLFSSCINSGHEAGGMMRCHLGCWILTQRDRINTKSPLFSLMIADVRFVCCSVKLTSHLLLATLLCPELHVNLFIWGH